MIDNVLYTIEACFDWFTEILHVTGMLYTVAGVILAYVTYRLLLKPLIGGKSGSDVVRRAKK